MQTSVNTFRIIVSLQFYLCATAMQHQSSARTSLSDLHKNDPSGKILIGNVVAIADPLSSRLDAKDRRRLATTSRDLRKYFSGDRKFDIPHTAKLAEIRKLGKNVPDTKTIKFANSTHAQVILQSFPNLDTLI
jgi:hypothetical protein